MINYRILKREKMFYIVEVSGGACVKDGIPSYKEALKLVKELMKEVVE